MIRSQTSRERCSGEGGRLGPERPTPGQSGTRLIEHDDDDDDDDDDVMMMMMMILLNISYCILYLHCNVIYI